MAFLDPKCPHIIHFKKTTLYNSQTSFQSIQAIGTELVTSSEFDFETRTTTISWSSTALLDSGEYGCSIEILTENNQLVSGSAKQQIDVFNVPSVRFSPANTEKLSFDIRSEQLNNEKSLKSIGYCHVTDAFPKPEYIIVQFGTVDFYLPITDNDRHQDEENRDSNIRRNAFPKSSLTTK